MSPNTDTRNLNIGIKNEIDIINNLKLFQKFVSNNPSKLILETAIIINIVE